MPVLDAAFPDGWLVYSGGGDFVLGCTEHYQGLHSDISPAAVHSGLRKYWPAPTVSVNFVIQQIDTADFGPLRVIPRRKVVQSMPECRPPLHLDEDEDMRHSTLFPLPV